MIKKKLLIFPYDANSYGIVRHLIETDNLVTVCSFVGSGLIERDVAYAVNQKELGIKVKLFSKELLEGIDTVLILRYKFSESVNMIAVKIIEEAMRDNSIDIRIDFGLNEFDNYMAEISRSECNLSKIDMSGEFNYYHTEVPIVAVGGLFETTDLSWIMIGVKNQLRKLGYKTITISNDCLNVLNESYAYPRDFISEKNSIENRIMLLNQYIKKVVLFEKPDIILLQITGGMMRFNDKYVNSFGSYAYMISEAIAIDYFIYSTPKNIFDISKLDELAIYFESRYGFCLESVHLSNILVNTQNLSSHSKCLEIKSLLAQSAY